MYSGRKKPVSHENVYNLYGMCLGIREKKNGKMQRYFYIYGFREYSCLDLILLCIYVCKEYELNENEYFVNMKKIDQEDIF